MEQNEKRVLIEKCSNCVFYTSDTYEDDRIEYESMSGFCQRFPPVRIDGAISAFPVVTCDCWCGEFCPDLEDKEDDVL